MMAESLLKLKWNSHLNSLLKVLESLRTKARYTDVTLACEGRLFTVHRLVLASCSQFFDHIFQQTPAENTVIVLNEAKAQDVESLLDYMYCGEVDVLQNNLGSFLRTAECLQIKGLAVPDDHYENDNPQPEFVETPPKKRKCSTRPSSADPSCLGSDRVNPNKEACKGSGSPSANKIPSPTLPNIIPSRWVFQRSDLPNTTWSSQGHSESVIIEKETILEPQKHPREENRTWASDAPEGNDSHTRLGNLKSEPIYYETHRNTSERQCQSEALPLKNNASIRLEAEEMEVKTEIKEEKMFVIDESENSNKDFHYPQELDLNHFHRERGEGVLTPISISDLRQSTTIKSFSNPDDHNTKLISITTPTERHSLSHGTKTTTSNIHMLENITSSSVENALSPNQQATLSPKLMPYAKCSNCYTNNTKLWRRSMNGEIVCNACGLYFKLHGVNRPSHLFRNAPMTRRRNPKKKRKGDEMGDVRDHYNSSEEMQDSYYNEGSCDTDTQEGLAVLNAALTLNSLFAKAKAQEAAAKNSNPHPNSGISSSNRIHPPSTETSSSTQYGCETNNASSESRPGPPPLLKLPLHSSPPSSRSQAFAPQLTTASAMSGDSSKAKYQEANSVGRSVPNAINKGLQVSANDLSLLTWQDESRINSKNEPSQFQKTLPVSSGFKDSAIAFVRDE